VKDPPLDRGCAGSWRSTGTPRTVTARWISDVAPESAHDLAVARERALTALNPLPSISRHSTTARTLAHSEPDPLRRSR
jgi:hypothetical protein